MEENRKASFKPFKIDIHRLLRFWVAKLFKGPYLPKDLVTFFILEGITFLGIVVMSQPYGFWKDPSLGFNTLGSEPFLFLAGCLIAILIAAFAFSVVNYRIALFAWIITTFVDLTSIGMWIQNCGISRWLPIITTCAGAVYYTNLAGSVVISFLLVTSFRLYKLEAISVAPIPQPIWKRLFIPAAWIVLLAAGVIWSGWGASSGWMPISVQADKLPSPRNLGEIVYDTKLQRAVMFGGRTAWLGNAYQYTNETWEWDGKQWAEMFPEHTPLARAGFGMAYDENRQVVVLFGGETTNGTVLGDTWEWDGRDWQRRSPSCACGPQARGWQKMIYDPQRGKTVVYGGSDNKGKFFNDGWDWDGVNWQPISFDAQTPAASDFMLVYDPATQYILGILNGYPSGTWAWQGTKWNRLSPTIEPSNRGDSGVAYEPDSKLIYLFGGWQAKIELNETWSFDGKDWKEYPNIVRPPVRTGSMMFYDPIRKHIVLFGGYGQGKYYNDMWELVLPKK